MSDPAERFASLTMLLEDPHGLTVEGQRADQPHEYLLVLSNQICNGLQRGLTICTEIDQMCGGSQ
ncbi:hypothetical protein [uncultured Erythrobacter sp.]|uniref:hypothetical protein n=1 Tax=uncultured Erythrobacter sp. TaxID=263913 RepID=UPI0026073FD1|nr:hypothetical protein [uncultured Erythrobacter sp.]